MAFVEFQCSKCRRNLGFDTTVSSDAWCARCGQHRVPADVSALTRAKADAKRLLSEFAKTRPDPHGIEAALASINRSTVAVLSELATAINNVAVNSPPPIRRKNQNGYKRKGLVNCPQSPNDHESRCNASH